MARDIFTIKHYKGYMALFFLGKFVGNYDNWKEVEEAKHEILGY